MIVECLKQFRGIPFDYEINVFSNHNNLVYAATLSESQRVMRWQLVPEELGPNIQHIAGVDKIIADTLSRFPSTPNDNNYPCKRKAQCRANRLFVIGREESNYICHTPNLLIEKKITTKVTEEHKFQPQYIHFGSRIRLLQARTRKC